MLLYVYQLDIIMYKLFKFSYNSPQVLVLEFPTILKK